MKSKIYLVNAGIDIIDVNSKTYFLPFSDENDYSSWDASRTTPISVLANVQEAANYIEDTVDGGVVFDPTKQYLYDLTSVADDKNSEYLGAPNVDEILFGDLIDPTDYVYNSDASNPNIFDSLESAFSITSASSATGTFRNTFNNENLYHSLSYNGFILFVQDEPGTTQPLPLLVVRFEDDQLIGAPLKLTGTGYDVRNKAFSRMYFPRLNVGFELKANTTLGSSSENFLQYNEFLISNKSLYLHDNNAPADFDEGWVTVSTEDKEGFRLGYGQNSNVDLSIKDTHIELDTGFSDGLLNVRGQTNYDSQNIDTFARIQSGGFNIGSNVNSGINAFTIGSDITNFGQFTEIISEVGLNNFILGSSIDVLESKESLYLGNGILVPNDDTNPGVINTKALISRYAELKDMIDSIAVGTDVDVHQAHNTVIFAVEFDSRNYETNNSIVIASQYSQYSNTYDSILFGRADNLSYSGFNKNAITFEGDLNLLSFDVDKATVYTTKNRVFAGSDYIRIGTPGNDFTEIYNGLSVYDGSTTSIKVSGTEIMIWETAPEYGLYFTNQPGPGDVIQIKRGSDSGLNIDQIVFTSNSIRIADATNPGITEIGYGEVYTTMISGFYINSNYAENFVEQGTSLSTANGKIELDFKDYSIRRIQGAPVGFGYTRYGRSIFPYSVTAGLEPPFHGDTVLNPSYTWFINSPIQLNNSAFVRNTPYNSDQRLVNGKIYANFRGYEGGKDGVPTNGGYIAQRNFTQAGQPTQVDDTCAYPMIFSNTATQDTRVLTSTFPYRNLGYVDDDKNTLVGEGMVNKFNFSDATRNTTLVDCSLQGPMSYLVNYGTDRYNEHAPAVDTSSYWQSGGININNMGSGPAALSYLKSIKIPVPTLIELDESKVMSYEYHNVITKHGPTGSQNIPDFNTVTYYVPFDIRRSDNGNMTVVSNSRINSGQTGIVTEMQLNREDYCDGVFNTTRNQTSLAYDKNGDWDMAIGWARDTKQNLVESVTVNALTGNGTNKVVIDLNIWATKCQFQSTSNYQYNSNIPEIYQGLYGGFSAKFIAGISIKYPQSITTTNLVFNKYLKIDLG